MCIANVFEIIKTMGNVWTAEKMEQDRAAAQEERTAAQARHDQLISLISSITAKTAEQPKLTHDEFEQLLARSRERVRREIVEDIKNNILFSGGSK